MAEQREQLGGGGDEQEMVAVEMPVVMRQDSLFRDASRAGGHGHHGMQQPGMEHWGKTLRLAFQCVGVLYGDIGTSPLYVYSSTFTSGTGGVGHTDDLLGVLSLIIYSFILFTMVKYVYIALRANDDGDGGTFALYSLISRHAKVSLVPNQQAEDELRVVGEEEDPKRSLSRRRRGLATLQLASPAAMRAQRVKELLETSKPVRVSLFLLTILATAMVISDACLTPAISVLSAVGGLKEKAPHLTTDQIVWMTVAILIGLFAVQRFGTDKVGYIFAPIIILWLLLIGAVGVYNLLKHDISVLRAFNPKYIYDYFHRNNKSAWVSLGGVLLCFTGTEALFADLGYFSIRSIQLSFAFFLVPSVLLCYAGQAAFLRKYPEEVANTFYRSTPEILFWPTFVLAILASIIGSQAMISCAFATISHSQALGCFPRVKILHTSKQYQGQLYIPEVNLFLAFAACVVTVAFKTTVVIGEAHGICVVLVMLITTLLLTVVMLLVWKVNLVWVAVFFSVFAASESVYLSSVLYKFLHGGYIPVVISAALMAVMTVWHYVHVKRYEYELERAVSPDRVVEILDGAGDRLRRVPGVGLFYTELVQGIPPVFPHLIDKIPSIHAVLLFVSVKHLPVPHVDVSERFLFRQVGACSDREHRMYRCVARYGYRDPLEEARDFVASLVERLQYYIRDVNLYVDAPRQQPQCNPVLGVGVLLGEPGARQGKVHVIRRHGQNEHEHAIVRVLHGEAVIREIHLRGGDDDAGGVLLGAVGAAPAGGGGGYGERQLMPAAVPGGEDELRGDGQDPGGAEVHREGDGERGGVHHGGERGGRQAAFLAAQEDHRQLRLRLPQEELQAGGEDARHSQVAAAQGRDVLRDLIRLIKLAAPPCLCISSSVACKEGRKD